MENLLADMCVEAEAHTLTALRLAHAYDNVKSGRASPGESAFFRMGVAVGKYWVTKRLPNFTFEAMEVSVVIPSCLLLKFELALQLRFLVEMDTQKIFLCREFIGLPRSTLSGKVQEMLCV